MRDWRRFGLALVCALLVALGALVELAAASGGGQVTSFSEVSGTAGMVPVASAAGPSAGDALIAGGLPSGMSVVPAIFAVTASMGQPDSSVGSSGRLPIPSGLPSSAQVKFVLFASNTIYASFFDGASGNAYVASWDAQGQLNSGFGTGGLVAIAPPSGQSFNPSGSHLANGSQLALVGGKLVLGEALLGNGGGINLYPLDPSSGTGGSSPVTTALPTGGFYFVDLDAMQPGPDGNLYLAGEAHGASTPLYYGVFNGSTLHNVSQTTQPDGDSASGDAIAFSGSSAYLGVTSVTSSVKTTQLWSAPQGSSTLTQGPDIPTQVSGQNQQLIGLQTDSSGPLDAVVDDGNGGGTGTTWVLQISGNAVGAAQQVGSTGDNAQVVTGDALLVSGNGYFADGEHVYLAIFGVPVVCSSMKLNAFSMIGAQGQDGAFPGNYPVTITTAATGGTAPYVQRNSVLIQVSRSSDTATWSAVDGLAPGTYTYTFSATDSGHPQCSATTSITLTVGGGTQPPPGGGGNCALKVTATASVQPYPPSLGSGYDVSVDTTVTGGHPPYKWKIPSRNPLYHQRVTAKDGSASNWLPNNGQSPGTYSYTFAVTDSSVPPCTSTITITVTVGPEATIGSGNVQTVTVGSGGTGTLPVSCGLRPSDVCTVGGEIDTGACTGSTAGGLCSNQSASSVCTSASSAVCTESHLRAVVARARHQPKVIVLGQIHGKVAGGRHGKVRLKLGPAGMRLLRAHHKLRERLVLRVTDKAGKTKTVDYAITLRLS